MLVKTQISKILPFCRRNLTRILLVFACPVVILWVVIAVHLAIPEQVELSLSPETCVSKPLLASFDGKINQQGFTLAIKKQSSDSPGKSLCIVPEKPTPPGVYALNSPIFGQSVLKRQIRLVVPEYPKAQFISADSLPISEPVRVKLSREDRLNSYSLKYQDKSIKCQPEGSSLQCQTGELGFEQGREYKLSVQRSFGGEPGEELAAKKITILEPVRVIDRSIEMDSTVYDRPGKIEIGSDKQISKVKVELASVEADKRTVIPSSTEMASPSSLVVNFAPGDLPRGSVIELQATSLVATDGSLAEQPVLARFTASDGPKVQSINIGTHDVATNRVVIKFDQELDVSQNIHDFVKVTGIASSLQVAGSQVTVLLSPADRCTAFDISLSPGLSSRHGVKSSTAWKHSSKTRCYEVRQIGASVQGRPINAYFFGGGGRTILYTGAIHGNELSSKYIMDDWITELSASPGRIPAGLQVVVVPVVSPDGVAAAKRYNANNINLNRNFPTANWVSDIGVAGGRVEAGAGGSSALSEPESASLANFTRQLNPSFVVTYHSAGSIVNSNDIGSSISIGQEYARLARYRFISNAQTNAVFGLEMTGTYEDWLAEIGIPAILLEMPNNTGRFFVSNKNAIWMTVQ